MGNTWGTEGEGSEWPAQQRPAGSPEGLGIALKGRELPPSTSLLQTAGEILWPCEP